MELLDFARGPALQFGLYVFAFGVAFRLAALLLLPRTKDLSKARADTPWLAVAAGREIVRRMWPEPIYADSTRFTTINGYIFHLGLAIIVFGGTPHILFIKDLFGISWPGLPTNIINGVAVITFFSLIAALVHRLQSPVLRAISTANDYITWGLTMLPVVTGLLAISHLGWRYETLLAVHILSIVVFLVWFPFGKLMHAFLIFFSRGTTGVHLAHRGAQS
jgi:nitrate reductase gamma subunit